MYWGMFLLWAGVIFYFSAQRDTVSGEQSGFFARFIEQMICWVVGENALDAALFDALHLFVRKAAHFTVYLILGVISERAYFHSGVKAGTWRFTLALLTCALYACTDEIHQYFVPGRAMMLTDVFIDSVGAMCGVLGSMCLMHARKKQ